MDAVPSLAPPVAVVLPGCPLITDFQCLDGVRWVRALGNAPEMLVVFLVPHSVLPPGTGLGIYIAREDDGSFMYIGHVSNALPSSILQVPQLFLNIDTPVRILLGVSQEREEDLENIGFTQQQPLAQRHAATKLALAERIAEDVFNFLMSYGNGSSRQNSDGSTEEIISLPASCLKLWRERILNKMSKDILFWR